MLKSNISWPIHRQYKSGTDWEPIRFFSDCLCNSTHFDLLLGFFSSSAIEILSNSFALFLHKGGRMRLVINNILSKEDKQVITSGSNIDADAPFDLSDLSKLKDTLSKRDKHFFECLAWLISNKRIEIKIIAPKSSIGISHTKQGVFRDDEQRVSFNGSCNFSKTALVYNIESIDVSCEWDENISKAKVENTVQTFNRTFFEQDPSVLYLDPKQLETNILSEFGDKSLHDLLQQERDIGEESSNANFRPTVKNILKQSSVLLDKAIQEQEEKERMPRFPWNSQPRDYQVEAFNKWKDNGQQGLFAMATGTGKTITALNCLLEIYNRREYYKAIILVPTISLLDQWVEECRKFNFRNIIKVNFRNKKWKGEIDEYSFQEKLLGHKEKVSYIIISTYTSFSKNNIFLRLNSLSSTRLLLIADEAHNMASGQMLKRLDSIVYGRRIGLSATPERQYDDEGNNALMRFFNAEKGYTYEYTMEEAIRNGVLCKYLYYPHIVKLTDNEMDSYSELTTRIAKIASAPRTTENNNILTQLFLKRKRIIHKAENKKHVFEKIVKDLYEENGSLSYTLVYAPEGDEPDYISGDNSSNSGFTDYSKESQNLIDQYTAIVRDVNPKITVKQFTSISSDRDNIIKDFASGKLEVLTSMKCLDEGIDVPQSKVAIFCASTGNPRQFIQRRGRVLRQSKETGKYMAIIHDLVVVPEFTISTSSYNVERRMLATEIKRVKNFALLSENSAVTIERLDSVLNYYNLSIY